MPLMRSWPSTLCRQGQPTFLPPEADLHGEMTCAEKNVTNTPAALVRVQRRAGRSASQRSRVPLAWVEGNAHRTVSSKRTEAVCLFYLLTTASLTQHMAH